MTQRDHRQAVGPASTRSDLDETLCSFPGGTVVQLVAGDPDRADAVVVPLVPATVEVTGSRVVAIVDGVEWPWSLRDIERVSHGEESPWTILAVPGVPDHGVALPPDDAREFRRHLGLALGNLVPGAAPAPPAPPSAPSAAQPVELPAASLVVDPGTPGDSRPSDSVGERLAGIEAREVSAWFGAHHVLDRISLAMPPGRVTALIGPSGCGKSTFLRILNRMHEMIPSAAVAGEVLLGGQDIYDSRRRLTDVRRQIGMVFQKPNPFPAMSIYDNVVASFRLTGARVSAAEKDQVVEGCLRKAGLWNEVRDRLRQLGGSLSGGQQQRLCIARALAIKPRVLLMDEPCSALDPTSTRRIEETIAELADEVTIVIVTHNMQQAARVSHQCAFFLAEQGTPGVIVEHGPTEAMFQAPQDERTRDYVHGRFG